MPQSILYYPTISVGDGPWLRAAALYWDEVCSIVPSSYLGRLSPELKYLLERGQYRPIDPQQILYSDYNEDFFRAIKRRFECVPSIAGHREREFRHVHRQKVEIHGIYDMIHYNKIPTNMRDWLLESGAILLSEDDEWVEMESRLAGIYMRTLAEFIARYDENDVVIGTDRRSSIHELYRGSAATVRNRVMALELTQCLPVPSPNTGYEEILDFKDSRKDDLYALQLRIQQLEYDLRHSESPEEVKSVLRAFKSAWEKELRNTEAMFRGDGIEFALNDMLTFVGAAGGASGLLQLTEAMCNTHFSRATIDAAVGMTGLVSVALRHKDYHRKIKAELQGSGFAYIIGAARNNLLRDVDLV